MIINAEVVKTMRVRIRLIGALLAVCGALAGIATVNVPTATAGAFERFGCPSGAVCIYSPKGWSNNKPEHAYFSYGVHKLHNEYGDHYVLNNQVGGHPATLNKGSNGGGIVTTLAQDARIRKNLTPINSITLYK